MDTRAFLRRAKKAQSKIAGVCAEIISRLEKFLSRRAGKATMYVAGLCFVALVVNTLWMDNLIENWERSLDPVIYEGDVTQQVVPFFLWDGEPQFEDDYAATYFLDCLPIGFKGLYVAGARLWHPEDLSTHLPYVLWLLTAIGLSIAAYRFTGWGGVLFALCFCVGADLFLRRMLGGLPRGFAFPLIALGLAALATGRPRFLAALTVVGAAFYPAAGVTLGFSLALWLFVLPKEDGPGWSRTRGAIWVVGTAVASAVVLAPAMIGSGRYGTVITRDDVEEFPEAGPGGRYSPRDRAPFLGFVPEALRLAEETVAFPGTTLFKWGKWRRIRKQDEDKREYEYMRSEEYKTKRTRKQRDWLSIVCLLAVVAWLRLFATNSAARRVGVVLLAGWLVHVLACQFPPRLYLPPRYATYLIPPWVVVIIAAAPAGLYSILIPRSARVVRRTIVAAVALLGMISFAADVSVEAAGKDRFPDDRGVFRIIRRLPRDSVVAGFPIGLMDHVPYRTRRRAFINAETHQAFHTAFVVEMRKRMRALIAAYFASSTAPMIKLKQQHGVTHLLVDTRHLDHPPKYFKPFNRAVDLAFSRNRKIGFEALRPDMPVAAVSRHYRLIDLSQLSHRDKK